MRASIALLALAGLASAVAGQTTVNSVAALTGTIQPGGPRQGVNGDNFFNIEGFNNGAFASYGVARWDLTTARAALDTAFGAGHWRVTKVELELTQANAVFSAAGGVKVYYSTDDTTEIKLLTSPLTYPFFDPITSAPDLALGNGGTPILTYSFAVIASGTLDRYTQTGSFQNGAANNPTEVLALAPEVVQDITTQNLLTLVFNDVDAGVAATYRGQIGAAGAVGPNLFITAEAMGGTPCYANCDASTLVPVLNVNDFTCFINRYAAGASYANCDASTIPPVLNVNDFTCFINRYAAGCAG